MIQEQAWLLFQEYYLVVCRRWRHSGTWSRAKLFTSLYQGFWPGDMFSQFDAIGSWSSWAQLEGNKERNKNVDCFWCAKVHYFVVHISHDKKYCTFKLSSQNGMVANSLRVIGNMAVELIVWLGWGACGVSILNFIWLEWYFIEDDAYMASKRLFVN